jgi:hypothetical protein
MTVEFSSVEASTKLPPEEKSKAFLYQDADECILQYILVM